VRHADAEKRPGRLPLLEAVLLRQAPSAFPAIGANTQESHESPSRILRQPRRAGQETLASAALNAAITLAEFVGGILSGSLALLSDAAHNLSDVVAIVLALMARRLGRRPPTTRHTYGSSAVEVVAALVNAVTLIAVTVLIAHQAVLRLFIPSRWRRDSCWWLPSAPWRNVGSALLLDSMTKGT